MSLPCFLWISPDTSTPSMERHQKFWPHMPFCMRVSQHFCLSQWFPVVSREPHLVIVGCSPWLSRPTHIFLSIDQHVISINDQCFIYISYLEKDAPNSPHQMIWPLPRCHSSIETGEGSVSVGVRAPSAGVLAATSVNRTVEPSQMCLCVFAKSTMDTRNALLVLAPWWCW